MCDATCWLCSGPPARPAPVPSAEMPPLTPGRVTCSAAQLLHEPVQTAALHSATAAGKHIVRSGCMLGVLSGLPVSAHLQGGYQVRWATAEDAHLAGPGVSSAAGVVSLQQYTCRPVRWPAMIGMIDVPHEEASVSAQTLPERLPGRMQLGWAQAVRAAPPGQTATRRGCLQTPAGWGRCLSEGCCRCNVIAHQCFDVAQLLHLVSVALAALLVACLQLALLFLPPVRQLHTMLRSSYTSYWQLILL